MFDSDSNITSIEVPATYRGLPVVEIDDFAFDGLSQVTTITLPSSVTKIGYESFYNCKSLESIDLTYVTSIGEEAFKNCSKLSTVTFGTLTTVGKEAFMATGLTSVDLSSSTITTLNESTFQNCSSIKSIVLPNTITEIKRCALAGCQMTSIILPENLETIGVQAFASCMALTTVVIPDTVEEIGMSAFGLCKSLESIVLPKNIKTIGNTAFSMTKLSKVYYKGSEAEFSSVTTNNSFTGSSIGTKASDATIYYYSETKPESSGNYWHYVNGEVTVWTE